MTETPKFEIMNIIFVGTKLNSIYQRLSRISISYTTLDLFTISFACHARRKFFNGRVVYLRCCWVRIADWSSWCHITSFMSTTNDLANIAFSSGQTLEIGWNRRTLANGISIPCSTILKEYPGYIYDSDTNLTGTIKLRYLYLPVFLHATHLANFATAESSISTVVESASHTGSVE